MPHGVDLLRCLERVRSAQNTEESTSCTLSIKIEPDSRGSSPAMTASKSSRPPSDRHPPRMRGIQYAAAYRLYRWRLWNTGSPAFAGDDSRNIVPHSRGANFFRPGHASNFPPPETKGVGNAGCTVHPRSRVQGIVVVRTRAYRSTEITRHPRTQWLYGLWRALPGDEFVLSPSPADKAC